jgi:hypothetical protein
LLSVTAPTENSVWPHDTRHGMMAGLLGAVPRDLGWDITGRKVLVDDGPQLVRGVVVWEFEDTGRRRALVRYASLSGVAVSRLHWVDELWPCWAAGACGDTYAGGEVAAPAVNSDTPVRRTTGCRRVIELPLRLSCH